MGYLDEYRKRMQVHGTDEKSRIENRRALDFNKYLKGPSRVIYSYKGQEKEGALISGVRTAAQLELKIIFYLLGKEEDRMPEGSIFTTYDRAYDKTRYWIILNAEVKSFYGYIKYKLLELDYHLKYVDKKGIVQVAPAYVVGTASFDIKEYFKFANEVAIQVPYRALNVIWTEHPEVDGNTNFIIGDEVWNYVDSDKISIPGIYYTTLYKTPRNVSNDSVEQQIADIQKINNTELISNYGTNKIIIDLQTRDLKFYLRKNGKIISSSLELSSKTPDIFRIEYSTIVPQKIGVGALLVKDKISGYEKLFQVEIREKLSDYFYIVGDTNLSAHFEKTLTINSDLNYSIRTSNDLIEYQQDGNKIKVKGDKLGQSALYFETSIGTIDYPLEVVGAWVR